MSRVNQTIHDLLVFDYILLHHHFNLHCIRYAIRHLVMQTLERREINISLPEELVIFNYLQNLKKYRYDVVELFSCCSLLLPTITNYFICYFNDSMSMSLSYFHLFFRLNFAHFYDTNFVLYCLNFLEHKLEILAF